MITSHSVKDQLKLLEEKKISFKELIREYLSNIKRDNNKYNAIVSLKDEADILDEQKKKTTIILQNRKIKYEACLLQLKISLTLKG